MLVALAPAWVVLQSRRDAARGAAWALAAALAWLAAGVLVDAVILATATTLPGAAHRLGRLLPILAVAFAAQAVTGALTYLLPTLWGRGAHGNRRITALLDTLWPWRLAAVNLGAVVALAGAAAGWLAPVGWILLAAGIGGFVPLAAAAAAVALSLRAEADHHAA